jgi:uncharacterized protein YdeI (YjbR/CyaY-like superfamily)
MNPQLDHFFQNAKQWKREMEELREIVLNCNLNEEEKWGVPCYTFSKGNILIIHGFKEYCALNFFKGALLQDAERTTWTYENGVITTISGTANVLNTVV